MVTFDDKSACPFNSFISSRKLDQYIVNSSRRGIDILLIAQNVSWRNLLHERTSLWEYLGLSHLPCLERKVPRKCFYTSIEGLLFRLRRSNPGLLVFFVSMQLFSGDLFVYILFSCFIYECFVIVNHFLFVVLICVT